MMSETSIFVSFISTIIISLINAAPSNPTCNHICPEIYQPICGQDNLGNLKIFDNQCLLQHTNCNNRMTEWRMVDFKKCLTIDNNCPQFCSIEYDPICGQDQTGNYKQFINLCNFKMAQCIDGESKWKFVSHSTCRTTFYVSRECFGACTMEYDPICALSSSGRMQQFDNNCVYENELCVNRDAIWKVINYGPC